MECCHFWLRANLANQVYAGTATANSALLWTGGAALGIVMRTCLCTLSSSKSHKIAFTILRNIRRTIANKMRRVPMGVMLETPSGVYKTLLVDNVGKLEDSIAHVIPEDSVPGCGHGVLPDCDFCTGLAYGACITDHTASCRTFYFWDDAGIRSKDEKRICVQAMK